MRRIWKMATVFLMSAVLLAGCGKDNSNAAEDGKKEEAAVTEEPEQDDTAENKEEQNKTENNTEQAESGDAQEDADSDDGESPDVTKEVELANEKEFLADYTTVDGLRLEAGSHIAFVVKNTDSGYWKTVITGINQAVADLNEYLGYKGSDSITCTIEGPKNETDIDGQVNILDAVIAENPDVVCLAAIDMDSCMAQLESATGETGIGIPVIVLDSGVRNEELIYSVCATDNRAAGREAAKHLCEEIGDEGQILIVSHMTTAETSQERVAGFQEEVKENHKNITVVRTISEPAKEGDPTIGEQLAEVMNNYPDLKGIFCTNEDMSVQMLTLMAQYRDRGIQLVGFDLGQTQLEAVRSGKEVGVISQNPYGMGYATVIAAVRAVLNLENDDFIDSGFQWLDKDTIDLEENAKYIYE